MIDMAKYDQQIKKIDTPEKLGVILESVVKELVHARVFMRLYNNINSSFGEYTREVNNAGTFWFLTRMSLYDASMIRLCRAYDLQSNANGLGFVLRCIEQNPEFFDLDLFKQRNPNYSLSNNAGRAANHPHPGQLTSDLKFLDPKGNAVQRLIAWRNNEFIHSNFDLKANGIRLAAEHRPTCGDFEELLARGLEIGNRYLGLFRGGVWSTQMVGEDDYQFVFKSLRASLIAHERKIARQIRNATPKPPK